MRRAMNVAWPVGMGMIAWLGVCAGCSEDGGTPLGGDTATAVPVASDSEAGSTGSGGGADSAVGDTGMVTDSGGVDTGSDTGGAGSDTGAATDSGGVDTGSDTGGAGSDTGSPDETDTGGDTAVDTQTGTSSCARDVRVADTPSLRTALTGAQPGDCIWVAPGTYAPSGTVSVSFAGSQRGVYFYSESSGTAEAPIAVRGEDPADPPVLRGEGTSGSKYLLWIHGAHWIVEDLVLENGGKGLVLDEASYSLIRNVTVRTIGDEGIHLRSGTSYARVEQCTVDTTGLAQPGFGEGIYVGSDNSVWDTYARECDHNVISGCTIRNTAAEGVDVKEGTTGTVITQCDIYGGAVSGQNSADSFIDLKGVDARVYANRFYKENNATVTRGVAIVDRRVELSAQGNWIYDNQFFLDDANGLMVHAYSGADNYAWNNQRTPAGEEYAGNAPELYLSDPRQ